MTTTLPAGAFGCICNFMPVSPVRRHAEEIATDCLASRTRHLDRLLARVYDGALRSRGITGSQLSLLVAIELGGPCRAADVGRVLELEKSTVSRNLARLIDGGLVEAADIPGRAATGGGLRVTARGQRLIAECHPLWRKAQHQARALLGPERSALLAAVPGAWTRARGRGPKTVNEKTREVTS